MNEPTADRELRLVLSTFPDAEAATRVGRALVDERLAACVNVVPGLRSIYLWQGKRCDEPEALAVLKTTADRWPALRDRLAALHPYEVPEILAVTPADVGAAYGAWVRTATSADAAD